MDMQTGAVGREQIEEQIDMILRGGSGLKPPEPVAVIEPEPFGRWLLAQKDRGDEIDYLASSARADAGFPKNGSADDVRDRLRDMERCGKPIPLAEAMEQIDMAERCWLSC